MALGVLARADKVGQQSSAPSFIDRMTLVGPASYTTGGDVGLAAALQAITKDQRTIVAVIQGDCGGYQVQYLPGTDALKVYQGDNTNAAAAPAIQVPNATNLAAVTFNLTILSK